MKYRYLTQTVTIPAGTPIGTGPSASVQMDQQFQKVIGVQVIVVSGTANFRMGLTQTNSGEVVQDITHVNDYISTTAVPLDTRYKTIDVPAQGNYISYSTQAITVPGADIVVDLIFKLKND